MSRTDDFYAYIGRTLPDGSKLAGIINVEKYRGPGKYTHQGDVALEVARGGDLFVWKLTTATLTVTPDGKEVLVAPTVLPALTGTPAVGSATVTGIAVCK